MFIFQGELITTCPRAEQLLKLRLEDITVFAQTVSLDYFAFNNGLLIGSSKCRLQPETALLIELSCMIAAT